MNNPAPAMSGTGPAQNASQSCAAAQLSWPRSHAAEPLRSFGRELAALPDELFDHRHLAYHCASPAFTRNRFASTIAPWLDRFDSHLTKRLENCLEHEAFSCLARAAVGTQLRRATTLHLEECEAVAETEGVMVRVAPECHELLTTPQAARTTDELNVADTDDTWPKTHPDARARLAPDQKHWVRMGEGVASVYAKNPDGGWCTPTHLHHEDRVYSATWSPSGQQLFTLSTRQIKVWSRCSQNLWKEVLTSAVPTQKDTQPFCHFSPDYRTLVLKSIYDLHVWCQSEDGRWTPQGPLDSPDSWMSKVVFSQDSCTMATLSSRNMESRRFCWILDQVFIWSRTHQGDWQREGVLAENPQIWFTTEERERQMTLAFTPEDSYLVALANNQALPDKLVVSQDPDELVTEGLSIRALALNIHRQLAVGYTLALPDDDPYKPPVRTCVEIWNFSCQPWQRQARLTIEKGKCADHYPPYANSDADITPATCGLLSSLTFSPDGRFLAAKDICGRVQAWCLVPPAVSPADEGMRAMSEQDASQ